MSAKVIALRRPEKPGCRGRGRVFRVDGLFRWLDYCEGCDDCAHRSLAIMRDITAKESRS